MLNGLLIDKEVFLPQRIWDVQWTFYPHSWVFEPRPIGSDESYVNLEMLTLLYGWDRGTVDSLGDPGNRGLLSTYSYQLNYK